jgi:hypothetical protein
MSRYRPMGNCPACSYRVPLRVDGTVGQHRDSRCGCGDANHWCEGTGQPSKWAEHNRQARERATACCPKRKTED